MTIDELITKKPNYLANYIHDIKSKYKAGIISEKELNDKASAYTKALCDAGILTDRERTRIYIYCTL